MHSRIPRRTALLCTVAAAVFALAGAATSVSAPVAAPPASPIKALSDSLKGLSLPAREAKLLDLAKKEGGTLELYTSLSSLITRNLLPAFEKAYPGIKVNLYRASSETLTQRILSEVSAGVAGPDVIETNGTEMSFFQNKTCRTGIRALAAGGPQTWSSDEEALAKRDHCYPPQLLRQAWDSVARRLAPG